MRFLYLLILVGIAVAPVQAQQKTTGSVKGTLVDAMNKLPLPDATVTLMSPADSSAVGFGVTTSAGAFLLKNIPAGSYIFFISYTGYSPLARNIEISPALQEINLDTVLLYTDTSMLAGVVVTAPPIKVKDDTVEFRAGSFKTLPNASAEDLFKKLPGVEVDKEGNITSQGEPITKIYVDGKEFFSSDPKLASKNIPAELIESVQVFDDMSDQAKFTRIDDGSRVRTINIKLKKNTKKGIFGRLHAAGGSSGRYETTASFSRFKDNRQISILGGANNTNRRGYTFNDLMSSGSDMRSFNRANNNAGGNAGNGNTRSWSTGINFRDEWGEKLRIGGNYFVARSANESRSERHRQNFFPNDSVALADERSLSSSANLNHRLGLRLEYQIDSMNSVLLIPNITVQQAESESIDSLITHATSPKFNYMAIRGISRRNNERDATSLNNELLFRHRFRKPGRTFTIGWRTALNDNNADGYTDAPYHFFRPDSSLDRTDDRQQLNRTRGKSFNNTISASVTEMIDTDKILELNYAFSRNKSINDRDTYDYDSTAGDFTIINKPLTNYFENVFESSRLGTNFRVKKQKYDFQLGGAVHFASLHNLSNRATTGKDSIMQQRYTNFFPNASFNYNLGTRKTIRFNYRGSTRAPSISQLQDVQDISNRLRIRTGNPDLKQEFTNNFRLSFNTMNMQNYLFVNFNLSGTVTGNKIVNSIDSLENAVQLVRPENVNGAFDVNFSGTVGIPLKQAVSGRRSPLNLHLTTTLGYNRDVSKLYKQLNFNYRHRVGQRIRFGWDIPDKLDLSASANFNYNDARYSVQEDLNYQYFNHSYSLDVTYFIIRNLVVNSDFDYYVNTGRAEGFNQPVPLWNAGCSWLLFEKRNGEIRFRVYDLLNQNRNIDRNVGDNYIEDTYTEVLQRYFMLSFTFNFNKFTGMQNRGRNNREQLPERRW